MVSAEDGLDEISIAAPTLVAELNNGEIQCYTITPEQFGLQRAELSALAVEGIESSLAIVQSVLKGQSGPARDIVCLNAGAAIFAANLSDTLAAGINKAEQVIDDGSAELKLEQLVAFSNRF